MTLGASSSRLGKKSHPGWQKLFSSLPNARESGSGVTARCPFCYDERDKKFDIIFSGNKFQFYKCFICNAYGRGYAGLRKLADQAGCRLSAMELEGMTASSDGGVGNARITVNGDVSYDNAPEESSECEPLSAWPPPWVEASDRTLELACEYVQKRGFDEPVEIMELFDIYVSDRVERVLKSGDVQLIEHPCIIAPTYGVDGLIYGWTTRRVDGEDKSNPSIQKSLVRSGSKWKTVSVFGSPQLNPSLPVVLVEGLFSALSTPNSVALLGKKPYQGQMELLAALDAPAYVFALDPKVPDRSFAESMYTISCLAPRSKVLFIDWSRHSGDPSMDPNDRGYEAMAEILKRETGFDF